MNIASVGTTAQGGARFVYTPRIPDVWVAGEQSYPDLVTLGQALRDGALEMPPEGLPVARAGIDARAVEKSARSAAKWNGLAGVCALGAGLTAFGGHLGLALGFGVGLGVAVYGTIRGKSEANRHAGERVVMEKGLVLDLPGQSGEPGPRVYRSEDGKTLVVLDPEPGQA